MTRTHHFVFLMLTAVACKDEGAPATHVTCENLDSRGIKDRLDDLVTNNTDVLDLDGHCLEATFNQVSGSAQSVRFAPQTEDGKVPNYHIQMYFLSPGESTQLVAHQPYDLTVPTCVDIPEGTFCGHVDNNEDDPSIDDVDFRILSGFIDMDITEQTDDETRYEGPFEWALGTIDTAGQQNSAAVRLEGTFRVTVKD